MTAKRRGPCAMYLLPIEPGEVITYERPVGARYLACSEREATRRPNLYPMPCDLCGVRLLRGQGQLTVDERLTEIGAWVRSWRATCTDYVECNRRIGGIEPYFSRDHFQ